MFVEKVLYFDPQSAPHRGYCPRCGGCLYGPTMTCLRCERRGIHDPAGDE